MHMVGGLAGFAGALVCRPRLRRFTANGRVTVQKIHETYFDFDMNHSLMLLLHTAGCGHPRK